MLVMKCLYENADNVLFESADSCVKVEREYNQAFDCSTFVATGVTPLVEGTKSTTVQ